MNNIETATYAVNNVISSSTELSSWSWLWIGILTLYAASEVLFYLYFHQHLLPHANHIRPEPREPYYDYPEASDKILLFRRILERLKQKAVRRYLRSNNNSNNKQGEEEDCDATECYHQVIQEFLVQWFEPTEQVKQMQKKQQQQQNAATDKLASEREGPPSLQSLFSMAATASTVSSNSSISSNSDANSVLSETEDSSCPPPPTKISLEPWTIPGLQWRAVREFFAWALFAKDTAHLSVQEQEGLDACFQCLGEMSGLVLENTGESLYEPRRLSLETVQSLHRSWLAYMLVAMGQAFGRRILLPLFGFQKVEADSVQLTAWYRPALRPENSKDVCLFFHGIAPSGLICYFPMVQALLSKRQQSLLMFENPSVQCQFHNLPDFQAITEEETVRGVHEILQKKKLASREHSLTLMGHSFGSCPVTWILRRRQSFEARFSHVILLDAVTVLLSEPTVMSRFLYDRDDSGKAHIRFLIASELFTEHYLRRHFCWYNSELWLEDFCGDDEKNPEKWTIVLSGNDEIVPSQTVFEHVTSLQKSSGFKNCNLVYWPHARHANCVMSPLRWQLMRTFLFNETKQKVE